MTMGRPKDGSPSNTATAHVPETVNKAVSTLTIQFLEWLEKRPRSYAESMEAWRTSCPRTSIWEDAMLEGLIEVKRGPGGSMSEARVRLTSHGRSALERSLRAAERSMGPPASASRRFD